MKKHLRALFFTVCLLISTSAWSQVEKGKVVGSAVDVYLDPSFDSDVVEQMKPGDIYLISPKPVGPFYKVKTKSGKTGFVPDTEIYVQGKGSLVPGANEVEDDPFLSSMNDPEDPPASKKKNDKRTKQQQEQDDEEELYASDVEWRGVTLSIINFHEDTMGGVQIDDLPALGYRYLSDITWGVQAAIKAPKYYEEKLNASARGFLLWGDFGISNDLAIRPPFKFRYGGGLFTRYSNFKISSATKSYDLQEMTVGAYLEGAVQYRLRRIPIDFSVRYWFDRESYGSFTLGVYF